MTTTRHKLRISWHKILKDDVYASEFGFHTRTMKHTDVFIDELCFWNYPSRTISKCWKDQSKKRRQWEELNIG